jgi:uncharacterized membrane protein YbhN (UPF0104 family)
MRKALSLLIKAAVSALLLYFALTAINIGAVKDRLNNVHPGWLVLGLMVLLLQLVVQAVRWRRLVIRCGADLAPLRAFRFTMIAAFFNQTLPSSVGGDAIRIWLVGRPDNWRAAAYSVFLDRVVGVLALAVLVVGCLPWSLALVRDPVGRAALLAIGLGCIAAGLIFVALASPRLRILQRWSLTRHLAASAAITLAILRSPGALAVIFGLSLVIHLLTALAAWCAARAIDANLPLLYAVYLVLPVVLIAVIPVSIAGWGVREGAMIAAFTYAGLSQSDGLLVSLLYGAGNLVLGVAGGLVWIATSERRGHGALSAAGAAD